jgi:hypothetical protein
MTTNEVWSPILFSAPMIRAIQGERKTETRRIVRWPDTEEPEDDTWVRDGWPYYRRLNRIGAYDEIPLACPYGSSAGHKLWVRETFSKMRLDCYPFPNCWYRADFTEHEDPSKGNHVGTPNQDGTCSGGASDCLACGDEKFKWKPSIHMRREYSRISLELTRDVRVERLQDMTNEAAMREGVIQTFLPLATVQGTTVYSVEPYPCSSVSGTPIDAIRVAWNALNGKRKLPEATWEENPWVWVLRFRLLVPTIPHTASKILAKDVAPAATAT